MSERIPCATAVVRNPAVKRERVVDRVELDHAARSRAEAVLTGQGGLAFSIGLASGTVLNDGDALKLEDGRLVEVRAAPEPLLEIRAEKPVRLLRVAWHLGGNHAAAEITPEAIYTPRSEFFAELARGQGCTTTPVTRPFQPERSVEHDCGHDHHHGRGHSHAHAEHHSHAEGGGHATAHAHAHASSHGHD